MKDEKLMLSESKEDSLLTDLGIDDLIEEFCVFAEGGAFYLMETAAEAERLRQDNAARKRLFAETIFKVFVAATHFANVSPSAWDIAQLVRSTPQEVFNWSKTPLWHSLLDDLGFKGDRTPQLPEHRQSIPKSLREDYLILQAFQKTSEVRFITYDGFTDARVKHVKKYAYILCDDPVLQKHDVILAFPKDRMRFVKNGIKVRKSIVAYNLRPIPRRQDRFEVDVAARRGAMVECIMQNGLVVTGENIWISKYNIVLRVGGKKGKGGKVILVYRHALLQFRVLQPQADDATGTCDDFDEADETDDSKDFLETLRRRVRLQNQQS